LYWRTEKVAGTYNVCEKVFVFTFATLAVAAVIVFLTTVSNNKI